MKRIMAAAAWCGLAGSCFATEITLESYAKNADSIAIGVVEFQPASAATLRKNEPWKVLAADLRFSGRFVVTETVRPDSALFAKNGVVLYVNGDYAVKGNGVRLHFFLQAPGQVLLNRTFDGDTSGLRQMTHCYGDEMVRRLFGDSGFFQSKMLCVKNKGRAKNLMIMDYDGFNRRHLTSCNCLNILPSFADSATYVWTSYSRGQAAIFIGSLATGMQHPFLPSRYMETTAAVSAVTGVMAFAWAKDGCMDIYTCNRDGSDMKKIIGSGSVDIAPSWSPSGGQFVFTSNRQGSPALYVADADGADTHRLTFEGPYQDEAAWSPRGDKIAYTSLTKGEFQIWVIQPDGSNPVQLTSSPGSKENPTWSPDASHIAFSWKTGGKTDIFITRNDGSHLSRITNFGKAIMPSWARP
ncbi:MAG TPA: hypothetical protein VLX68_14895 [Chitinivibrionales bacterium]|nr:hypothetical protein [Chitinivibrionales bacterium]